MFIIDHLRVDGFLKLFLRVMLDGEETKRFLGCVFVCVCLSKEKENMNVCGLCVEVRACLQKNPSDHHCLASLLLDLQRVT